MRKLFRNRAALISLIYLIVLIGAAIAAPIIAPYHPNAVDMTNLRQGPTIKHLLGTDALGRDILSRLIYGARISLAVGVLSVVLAAVIGIPLGLVAGVEGGSAADDVIMRVMDVMMAFPRILLAIVIVAVLGPGLFNMMLAIGVWTVPTFARLTRASALSVRTQEFVSAAEASGARRARILFKHVLPACLGPLVVAASLSMASAILTEAGLSFLGLGVKPGTPDWGLMLADGREYLLEAPHIATFPGLAITITVLAFNFLGDGLRDVLDPHMKG